MMMKTSLKMAWMMNSSLQKDGFDQDGRVYQRMSGLELQLQVTPFYPSMSMSDPERGERNHHHNCCQKRPIAMSNSPSPSLAATLRPHGVVLYLQ